MGVSYNIAMATEVIWPLPLMSVHVLIEKHWKYKTQVVKNYLTYQLQAVFAFEIGESQKPNIYVILFVLCLAES